MTFNANIPQVTDTMAKSQRQINANFRSISNVFAENHVNLNDEFQGMHKNVTFREQIGDPVTASDQIALYTKAVSSIPNLFFRPKSNQTPIQLTYPSLITGIDPGNTPNYFLRQNTFIAGPFIVYMGTIVGASPGTIVTLTPTSTLIYAGLTIQSNVLGNIFYAIPVIAGSGFTIQFQTGLPVQNIYYFAIGKP